MLYFAYGSNMSSSRLQERAPSAVLLGRFALMQHDLRFHKIGKDGSAKCDAYFTASEKDITFGTLFRINPSDKAALDHAEGLGDGYDEKEVFVLAGDGSRSRATTYVAIQINKTLKPFSWYVNHLLVGAAEARLPESYIEQKIVAAEAVEDHDKERDARERSIHD